MCCRVRLWFWKDQTFFMVSVRSKNLLTAKHHTFVKSNSLLPLHFFRRHRHQRLLFSQATVAKRSSYFKARWPWLILMNDEYWRLVWVVLSSMLVAISVMVMVQVLCFGLDLLAVLVMSMLTELFFFICQIRLINFRLILTIIIALIFTIICAIGWIWSVRVWSKCSSYTFYLLVTMLMVKLMCRPTTISLLVLLVI